MNPNLQSPIPSVRSITGEGWAAIIGAIGPAFLLAKKLLTPKLAKSEPISRADFFAETLATRERLHANHLALLEKLDANHRELLAALDRQATRVSALESSLARVDERTTKGGRASS
jgi:recombinational DNA repair ATPase RecF